MSQQSIEKFKSDYEISVYFECSALTGENVREVVQAATNLITV